MATMSISLPDKMRAFVKSRVESGDYHNESEYIRDLIRREVEDQAAETLLLEQLRASLASGISNKTVDDILAEPIENASG